MNEIEIQWGTHKQFGNHQTSSLEFFNQSEIAKWILIFKNDSQELFRKTKNRLHHHWSVHRISKKLRTTDELLCLLSWNKCSVYLFSNFNAMLRRLKYKKSTSDLCFWHFEIKIEKHSSLPTKTVRKTHSELGERSNWFFRFSDFLTDFFRIFSTKIWEIHVRFLFFQKILKTTRKLPKSELTTLSELRERSSWSSLPKQPKIYQNPAAKKNQDPIEKCEHLAKIWI